MFCPKCGTPYLENDKFCSVCATKLDTEDSVEVKKPANDRNQSYEPLFTQPEETEILEETVTSSFPETSPVSEEPPYSEPVYEEPVRYTQQNPQPIYQTKNSRSAPKPQRVETKHENDDDDGVKKFKSISDYTFYEVKRLGSSPAMIAATIMFTFGLLFTLNTDLFGSLHYYMQETSNDTLRYILGDLLEYIYEIPFLDKISSGLGMIANFPSILYAISMWIIMGSSFDKYTKKIKTGALTIVKTMVIISMVFSILFYATLTLISLTSFHYLRYMDETAALIVCLIPIAVLVFTIMYYVCLLSTLGSISDAASYGQPATKISGFLIFCCYFSGIVSIIGCVGDLTKLPSAIAVLLFGILLGNCKDAMRNVAACGRGYRE